MLLQTVSFLYTLTFDVCFEAIEYNLISISYILFIFIMITKVMTRIDRNTSLRACLCTFQWRCFPEEHTRVPVTIMTEVKSRQTIRILTF